MNTPDIIAEAKKRLAELDAEREKLLRMIAAAEGAEPVRPVPAAPFSPCIPYSPPHMPITPNDWPPGPIVTWTMPLTEEQGPVWAERAQQDLKRFGSFTICASSSMAWNGLPSEFGPALHVTCGDTTMLGDVWVGDTLGSRRLPPGRYAS